MHNVFVRERTVQKKADLITIVITHFWIIPQFTFFSLFKIIKYKKIKKYYKKYNSEKKRMPKRSKNGQN
jgi:hypothetical protein